MDDPNKDAYGEHYKSGLDDGVPIAPICGRIIETICTKSPNHKGLCSHTHRTAQPQKGEKCLKTQQR